MLCTFVSVCFPATVPPTVLIRWILHLSYTRWLMPCLVDAIDALDTGIARFRPWTNFAVSVFGVVLLLCRGTGNWKLKNNVHASLLRPLEDCTRSLGGAGVGRRVGSFVSAKVLGGGKLFIPLYTNYFGLLWSNGPSPARRKLLQ